MLFSIKSLSKINDSWNKIMTRFWLKEIRYDSDIFLVLMMYNEEGKGGEKINFYNFVLSGHPFGWVAI